MHLSSMHTRLTGSAATAMAQLRYAALLIGMLDYLKDSGHDQRAAGLKASTLRL